MSRLETAAEYFRRNLEFARGKALRKSIAARECYCTMTFSVASITYQPQHLIRTMIGAKVWQGIALCRMGKASSHAGWRESLHRLTS